MKLQVYKVKQNHDNWSVLKFHQLPGHRLVPETAVAFDLTQGFDEIRAS